VSNQRVIMGRQLNFEITKELNEEMIAKILSVMEEPVLWKRSYTSKEDVKPLYIKKSDLESIRNYITFPESILILVSEKKYINKMTYEYYEYGKKYTMTDYFSLPYFEYRYYFLSSYEAKAGRVAAFYNPKEYPAFEKTFNKVRSEIKKLIKKAGLPNAIR